MSERRGCRTGALALAVALLAAVPGCTDRPATSGPVAGTTTPAHRPAAVDDVRRTLQRAVRDGAVPGAVAVLRHGDRTDVLATGLADVVGRVPMTSAHRFRAASLTKPMVATVVLQLVEEGRLSLDDTVERWLPGLLAAGGRITVEQLLSHTSGLPEFNVTPADWPILRHHPVDQHALVVAAGRAEPAFRPGRGQAYSNTNYTVLGMVVERVTGVSLAANLDRRIFRPVGMPSASVRRARVAEEPLAHGYVHGTDAAGWDLTWGWAAGGLVADAPDVDRFLDALLRGGLVAPAVVDRMVRPVAGPLGRWSGYGLGLARLATRCGEAVGHTGTVDGYVTVAYALPRARRSVVLMLSTDRDPFGDLVTGVVETGLCG